MDFEVVFDYIRIDYLFLGLSLARVEKVEGDTVFLLGKILILICLRKFFSKGKFNSILFLI